MNLEQLKTAMQRPYSTCARNDCGRPSFMRSFNNDGVLIEELCEEHNMEDVRAANAEVKSVDRMSR